MTTMDLTFITIATQALLVAMITFSIWKSCRR